MKIHQIALPSNQYEAFKYPAGETQVRFHSAEIKKSLDADEIFVTAKLTNAEQVIELANLTDAIQRVSEGKRRTLILPYLPYSRADRRFTEGDCFGLKVFGSMIDNLAYDRVVTVDVHSDRAGHYISNLLCISPMDLIRDIIKSMPEKTVILLPDEGAARYGLDKELHVLHCEKVRDAKTGALLHFKVPTDEQLKAYDNVLIVDDICDGGGTFIGIAKQLECYKKKLYLYVTHGIFSKGFTDLAHYFERIYTTDSFYDDAAFHSSKMWGPATNDFTTVLPIGGLILKHLLDPNDLWKLAVERETTHA